MRSVHSPQRQRSVLPTRPPFTTHHNGAKKEVCKKQKKKSNNGRDSSIGVFVALLCPKLDFAQIPDRKPRLHTHILCRIKTHRSLKIAPQANASPQKTGKRKKKAHKILTAPRIRQFSFLFGFVHHPPFSFLPRRVIERAQMTNGRVSVREGKKDKIRPREIDLRMLLWELS